MDELDQASYQMLLTETVQTRNRDCPLPEKAGGPEWRSWLLALSSRGWYRKSCTLQSSEGMNLAWFERIGLYDMQANYE